MTKSRTAVLLASLVLLSPTQGAQAALVTVPVESSNSPAWLRSDGGSGTNMPAGGPAVWNTRFVTSLPPGANNISFRLDTLFIDDKGVLRLNGLTIADAVVQRPNGTAAGQGTMDFGSGNGSEAYFYAGFSPGAMFSVANGTTTFTLVTFVNDTSSTNPSAPPLSVVFISGITLSGILTYDDGLIFADGFE